MGKSRKKKLVTTHQQPHPTSHPSHTSSTSAATLSALAQRAFYADGTSGHHISTIETATIAINTTTNVNLTNLNNHTVGSCKPMISDLNALACAALASTNDRRVMTTKSSRTTATVAASITATTIDPMNLHPIINPTTEQNIENLPYILDYQTLDNVKLTRALLEEQKCSIAHEETYKLLSKYAHTRPDVDARLKARQDEMERSVLVATKEVEKHYRQKAVRMHPDKLGESARPKFERLTAARDVFKDATLRNLYLREMVSVVHKVGDHFIPSSHDAWVKTNQPDGMQDARTSHRNVVRSNANSSNNARQQQHSHQQKIQLEGGLLFQKPRVPEIVVLDTTARLIRVSLPILRPEYQFYQYIHRIDITFTSPQLIPVCYDNNNNSDNETNDQTNNNNNSHKLSLTRSQITSQIIQNFYPSTIDGGTTILPSEGEWFVSWTATMQDATDDDDNDNKKKKSQTKYQKSPPSTEACLEIMSAETIRRRIQRIDEDSNATRSIRRIDAVMLELKRHKSIGTTSTTQYNVLHSAIVRARGVQRRLFYLLKVTGALLVETGKTTVGDGGEVKFNHDDIINQPFKRLQDKIQACGPTLLTLQTSRQAEVKKDALKMFKHHIAIILESNPDILSWICNVQEKDLHSHGGDANRLYQLFVEGKGKAFVLELDSDLLEEASARTDLFTPRQCKDLRLKGKAVKSNEEGDEKEIMAEAAKLKDEREKAFELEQKAKLSLVGETVKFRGLASESGRKLNGKLGKVMEYLVGDCDTAGGDRYRVEYIGDVNGGAGSIAKGKVFSVKPENMEANTSCYLESTSTSISVPTSTSTKTPVPPGAAILVNSNNIEEVIEGIISGSIGGGDEKTKASSGTISGVITGSVGGQTAEGKTKAPPQDPPQQKLQQKRQKKKQQQKPQPQSKDPFTAVLETDKNDPHESTASAPTVNNQKDACKNKNTNNNSSKEKIADGKSWSCAACTLYHEGRLALYMNCHACGLARGPRSGSYSAKISSTATTTKAASAKKGKDTASKKVASSTSSGLDSIDSGAPDVVPSSSKEGVDSLSETKVPSSVPFESWMESPMPNVQKVPKAGVKKQNRNRNRSQKKAAPPQWSLPSSSSSVSSSSSSSSSEVPFESLVRGSVRKSNKAAPKVPTTVTKRSFPQPKEIKVAPPQITLPSPVPSSLSSQTEELYGIVEHDIPPSGFKAIDPVTGKILCKYGSQCRKPPGSCTFAHPETCKTINILEQQVGSVIGKNGWHIREIAKESGAFVSVDTKNKLVIQGQKAMMVHFAGSQKATEDAIQLVKNCLLVYDGEDVGELQFGGSNSVSPAVPIGGQPPTQGKAPPKNKPQEPAVSTVNNTPIAWGQSKVVDESSTKVIPVDPTPPTETNTEKAILRQDTITPPKLSISHPPQDESIPVPRTTSSVSSESNSSILDLVTAIPNIDGTSSQNEGPSEYAVVATTHDNNNTNPIQNDIPQTLLTHNIVGANKPPPPSIQQYPSEHPAVATIHDTKKASLIQIDIQQALLTQNILLANKTPPSHQHDTVPTEIFDHILNIRDSSIPQIRRHPVQLQQASETSSVSSLADFSHLKLSEKTLGCPAEEAETTKNFSSVVDNNDIGADDKQRLSLFLQSQKACIKGPPEDLFHWLVNSEDIASLSDLAEAVSDDDYVRECLQVGNGQTGLKGFKRNVFKKAHLAISMDDGRGGVGGGPSNNDATCETGESRALSSGTMATAPNSSVMGSIAQDDFGYSSFFNDGLVSQNSFDIGSIMRRSISRGSNALNDNNIDVIDDGPPELYCPISHELMINDPVLALDGITCDRCAIEDWFTRKLTEIQVAGQKLVADPSLTNERYIVARGVVSPVRDYQLPHLTLTANISIRNMARDYLSKTNINFR